LRQPWWLTVVVPVVSIAVALVLSGVVLFLTGHPPLKSFHRIIDAAFIAQTLDQNDVVADIGRAHEVLKLVLQPLNYRNLDELPEFRGKNTTTEFLAKYVFDKLASAARAGELGREGRELGAIRVKIAESHVARASYEAPLW